MSSSDPAVSSEGQLGLFDTVSIIVGIVIGTTIFELPWLIFANTPNVWMALSVWIFGGVLAFIGGLCYAELATTYPRAGGDYYYLTQAFGRFTGFLFGWAQLSVILPASIGVMAFVFAKRATEEFGKFQEISFFPEGFRTQLADFGLSSDFYYAATAVLIITLLNMLGVVLGKLAQNILTIAKTIGLLAIVGCGFYVGEFNAPDWKAPAGPDDLGWGALALILVLYAFGGWNDAAFVAAEIRDRRRNIPRALLLGITAITLIYLLINVAYIIGLGWANVRAPGSLPESLLREGTASLFGPEMAVRGEQAMRLIVMASALGAVNGLIFTGSRVYATLGADHRLFGFLGGWRPGRGAPILALLLQALITIGLAVLFGTAQGHAAINGFLDELNAHASSVVQMIDADLYVNIAYKPDWVPSDAFGELVSHSAPAFWLFFLLTGFSLFALRSKNAMLTRPFSVPWYPVTPFIFCNMCIYMLYRSTIYIEWRTLFVVALLLLGIPLYGLSQMLGVPKPKTDTI